MTRRCLCALATLCASLLIAPAWAAPPKIAPLEKLDYGSKTLKKYKLKDFVPQVGHNRRLSSLSFSADGAILVTASGLDDGMVKVWDTTRGHLLHTLKAEDYASVSPDGKTIATGNVGGPIELWDTETGARLKEIKGSGPVGFSPDGAYLVGEAIAANGGSDGTLQLWEVAKDYAPGRKLEGHEGGLLGLSFSADGQFVASSSFDTSIKVWSLKSFELTRTYQKEDREVVAMALSPDAETLAVSLRGEQGVVLWDVSAQKVEKTLKGHAKTVTGLAFGPEGKTLASSGLDDTTRLWDVAAGTQKKSVPGGGLVAFSGKQGMLAHGHHAVALVDAGTLANKHTFAANQALAFASAFTADGKHLVTTNSTTTIDIWNTKTGVLEKSDVLAKPGQVELILSPSGKHVALRPLEGNTIVVRDIKAGKDVYTFDVPRASSVRGVQFGPGDKELVIEGTEDGVDATRLTWWDLGAGKAIASTKLSGFVHVHGFVEGGKKVAMASFGTNRSSRLSLLLWDRESGLMKKVKVKEVAPYSGAIAFSPKGGMVALGTDEHTIKMMDVASKSMKRTMSKHADLVNVAGFSADGSMLATGSWDKTLRLWDVTKDAPVLVVDDLLYKAQHVAFSPDGKTIAVAQTGWVRLMHLPSGRTRRMHRFNTGGWLSYDTNGHFACDRKGCEAAFWRDKKGAWVGAGDKHVKKLRGLKALR